jgi:hypothetical protein
MLHCIGRGRQILLMARIALLQQHVADTQIPGKSLECSELFQPAGTREFCGCMGLPNKCRY